MNIQIQLKNEELCMQSFKLGVTRSKQKYVLSPIFSKIVAIPLLTPLLSFRITWWDKLHWQTWPIDLLRPIIIMKVYSWFVVATAR